MLGTILLLAQVTSGLAADGVGPFDGQWTGSATPAVQKCKPANVTVTVEGTTVIGQAQFANDASDINGTVREDGGFGATIGWQPLTGKFVADGFEGTFKNGDCEWKMRLQRSEREHLLPIIKQPKQTSANRSPNLPLARERQGVISPSAVWARRNGGGTQSGGNVSSGTTASFTNVRTYSNALTNGSTTNRKLYLRHQMKNSDALKPSFNLHEPARRKLSD